MHVDTKTEQAARAFFEKIVPDVSWDYTDHKAKNLILSAFHLYGRSWSAGPGQRWDIRRWEWPFAALRGEHKFEGDEPWTILLRRAVELSKRQRRAFQAVQVSSGGGESILDTFTVTKKRSADQAYALAEQLCESARQMKHRPIAFVREINA